MTSEGVVLLALLKELRSVHDGDSAKAGVTQLDHTMQTATLARRDGADAELQVVALLHDVGKTLNDAHHGSVVAEIMRGRLSSDRLAILRHHSEFQDAAWQGMDPPSAYADQPWFEDAVRLGGWDAAAFDPDVDADSLASFMPVLMEFLRYRGEFGMAA